MNAIHSHTYLLIFEKDRFLKSACCYVTFSRPSRSFLFITWCYTSGCWFWSISGEATWRAIHCTSTVYSQRKCSTVQCHCVQCYRSSAICPSETKRPAFNKPLCAHLTCRSLSRSIPDLFWQGSLYNLLSYLYVPCEHQIKQ